MPDSTDTRVELAINGDDLHATIWIANLVDRPLWIAARPTEGPGFATESGWKGTRVNPIAVEPTGWEVSAVFSLSELSEAFGDQPWEIALVEDIVGDVGQGETIEAIGPPARETIAVVRGSP